MKKSTRFLAATALSLGALVSSAEVEFKGPDLTKGGALLFSAVAAAPGGPSYSTLLSADLASGAISTLSFYPERIALVDQARALQVQNRFGVFRSDAAFANFRAVKGFASFESGAAIASGALLPVGSSPDGRYLVVMKPESPAYATLSVLEVATGRETRVSKTVGVEFGAAPALWSPDSRFFVYSKGGSLRYFSVSQLESGRVPDESYRVIGEGVLPQARWGAAGELYYVSGYHVYRIMPGELFTRTLYADMLDIGDIVGKLPFEFDPNFDSFWMSPDGRKILYDKDGRNLFLYYLSSEDYSESATGLVMPALFLPRSATVLDALWAPDGTVTVLTSNISGGKRRTGVFRAAMAAGAAGGQFAEVPTPDAREIVPSPDGSMVAMVSDAGIKVLDYAGWKEKYSVAYDGPLHVLWLAADELVIAGPLSIERRKLGAAAGTILAPSQAEAYGYDQATGLPALRAGANSWTLREGKWAAAASFSVADASSASPTYRIYLDELAAGPYKNTVMVRKVVGLGTAALFLAPALKYDAFPDKDEPRDPDLFSHGSRLRRREVALAFDAVDEAEGLTAALNALADRGLRATFFVNGEFMRRNPGAVKEIAESGHEIGSLFFANFDMTDSKYKIDAEFIKRGLARNEDDYYAITGKELSLVWHTPFYAVSTTILDAGRAMGYSFVGRDVDSLDWVTESLSYKYPGTYMPAGDLVERVIKLKKPGSIIPIRIGIPKGERKDFLFNKVELLLNALAEQGYAVVPVSTLMEHAK